MDVCVEEDIIANLVGIEDNIDRDRWRSVHLCNRCSSNCFLFVAKLMDFAKLLKTSDGYRLVGGAAVPPL